MVHDTKQITDTALRLTAATARFSLDRARVASRVADTKRTPDSRLLVTATLANWGGAHRSHLNRQLRLPEQLI